MSDDVNEAVNDETSAVDVQYDVYMGDTTGSIPLNGFAIASPNISRDWEEDNRRARAIEYAIDTLKTKENVTVAQIDELISYFYGIIKYGPKHLSNKSTPCTCDKSESKQ